MRDQRRRNHDDRTHPRRSKASYVEAQTSAPEVVQRITEMEICLRRLANTVLASNYREKHTELCTFAEEAKLLLKNGLEVDARKHRFHSEWGRIREESGF
jgi:hypothetical protein